MNLRKDKVIYTMWLTKEEEKGLLEIIEDDLYNRQVGKLFHRVHKRGDFNKR